MRPCVRCGATPRLGDLFICESCWASFDRVAEQRVAEELFYRHADQRRWLVAEQGWKGGWGTRGA